MPIIFVDANIYLDFFGQHANAHRLLLKTLASVSAYIFVTEQIASEVNRRKLDLFLSTIRSGGPSFTFNAKPPVLFEPDDDRLARQWAKDQDAMTQKVKALHASLHGRLEKVAAEISMSEDAVSASLALVLAKAARPSAEELSAARLRKEIGNPPGKRDSPIGDQISWEQLLGHAKKGDAIWIVSRDTDFLSKLGETVLLNPYLFAELQDRIGKDGSIHCFDDLLSALKHFQIHSGKSVKNLPTKEGQEQIESERQRFSNIFTQVPIPVSGTASAVLPSLTGGSNASPAGIHIETQSPYTTFATGTTATTGLFGPLMLCPRCAYSGPPDALYNSASGARMFACPKCLFTF